MKRVAKTFVEKLPVAAKEKPASTISEVVSVNKKALRKRVKACKPHHSKNFRGKCGRRK